MDITMIRMRDKFEGVKAAGRKANKVLTYVSYAHSPHTSNSWSLYECERDIGPNRNASAGLYCAGEWDLPMWSRYLMLVELNFANI